MRRSVINQISEAVMTPVVGIVEDNKKIRDLIQRYLDMQDELSCPVAVDSVEEMLEHLAEHEQPRVILMDIQLPGMSGIKGIGLIKEKYPDIDIIMLTIYHDSHKIFNALRAGASGYLLKHTSLPEIKESIVKLIDGGAPMSPQIARKVINHFQENAPKKNPESDLTPREHDIVNGLTDGLSYKMIADRFDISIDTVRAHIRNIYKKLHVNSKAEVIAKSLKGEI
jgi:DNA-binding NarL/FixJ family response regulator